MVVLMGYVSLPEGKLVGFCQANLTKNRIPSPKLKFSPMRIEVSKNNGTPNHPFL